MKVIIAGSRHFALDLPLIELAIRRSGFHITEVLQGGCQGVDATAQAWAAINNIPCREFPAEWRKFGRSAGPKRNAKMVSEADALIAIPAKNSRGTKDIIKKAERAGLKVFVLHEKNRLDFPLRRD